MRFPILSALLCIPVLCAAKVPSIPSLAGKKVAVLGFGLEKSIVREGDAADQGPGLVQKASSYYEAHQKATDTVYARFLAAFPSLFEGMDILPIDSTIKLAGFQTATACVPKKILGREIFGCPMLSPTGGLNAVGLTQAEKNVDAFAKSLGLDYYFLFVNKAGYFMSTGGGVNGLTAGAAKMRLETTVYLVQPGKGSVWSTSLREESETSKAMVGDLYSQDNFVLAGEAFTKFVPKLRERLAPVPAAAP